MEEETHPLLNKKPSFCTAACCFWHMDNVRDGIATFAVSGAAYFFLNNVFNITSLSDTGKVVLAITFGAVIGGYTVARNIQKKCSSPDAADLESGLNMR